MGWFSFKKENKGIEVDSYQSFSTPFGKVGKGNLSLPYINDRYTGGGGYVLFGEGNLYPQLLNQMYYASPLHSSICNFVAKATVGGGYDYGLEGKSATETVDFYTFDKKYKVQKLVMPVALDLILHNRVYFVLNMKTKAMKRIAPEKVRINKDKSLYFICDDWSSNIDIRTIKPYSRDCKDVEQLYCYESYSVGQDVYSLPSYSSAMNWIFLDGDMSNLHKSNIQNSIFPSFMMMFPKKFQNDEEKREVRKSLEQAKGSNEAGKIIVLTGNQKELMPDLVPIPTNQNDKLFIETDEQINLKICQAHTIDPMLMGVRVSGKLGGGSDIKQAYIIFEKNTIMPLREEVQEIFNDLLIFQGMTPSFVLNDFQIINETIIETDADSNKVTDALNSMSPLVATKVLDTLTPNEIRGLAGLKKVAGGDEVKPSEGTNYQPTIQV